MKILIISDSLPPLLNGVSTTTVETSRVFENLGHEVQIITAKQSKKVEIPELKSTKIIYRTSVPLVVYPNFRIAIPNLPKTLIQIKTFEPDIVHSFGPSPLSVDALIACKMLHIPYISTFTTLINSKEFLQIAVNQKYTDHLKKMVESYFKWFYNSNSLVFSETHEMRNKMIDLGINSSLIRVAPSPFDFYNIKPKTEQEREKLKNEFGFSENTALYVGRLSKEKALDTLIHIWKIVVKKIHNAQLVIVGSGGEYDMLKNLVETINLQKNVTFYGGIPHNIVINSGILAAADIFTSASTAETLGISTLEAMAFETPVVLFEAQGIAESVTDQGIIVEKGNLDKYAKSIIKLFNNKDLARKLGKNGPKLSADYGGEKACQRYLGYYKELLAEIKPIQH